MAKQNKLNDLMFRNDIKRITLAHAVGMSVQFLSQIINGKRPVPARYKIRILDFFQKIDPNLKEEDIFDGDQYKHVGGRNYIGSKYDKSEEE